MINKQDVDFGEVAKSIEVKAFSNKEFGEIRTLEIENKPYFIGSDVAKSLGYKKPSNAISRHCIHALKRGIGVKTGITKGGNYAIQTIQMNVIPEGDLYRLIINSELPSAERFEAWVFDEVLPSIRKHGAYLTDEKIEEVLMDPDTIIKLATQLKEERVLVKKQEQIIGELKPKADYLDSILKSKSLVTITQIAKDYGMSGQAMNTLLNNLKVQYKQGDQWLLYARYHSKGYTHSETIDITRSNGSPDVKMNTKWTQKGRLFLYELLKSEGYVPVIEQEQEVQGGQS